MESQRKVAEAITAVRSEMPEEVETLRFETGLDADDEPALWVWVVLKESELDSKWTVENRRRIRDSIVRGLRSAGVPLWTYIRFRSTSEEESGPANNPAP